MNIESLRNYCLSLPHVTEDVKWGNDLCFLIAEKMFCATSLEGPFGISFKMPPEAFEEMTTRENVMPAPYLARYNWVLVKNQEELTEEEWKKYIQQSYELVKSRLPVGVREQLS